ncbi:MAG: ATP-binding cassette domain-containing protein [Candidatus Adiutrix sp.]|jgi:putative ABC transport system ATP-binding protein|nr:ATP-binding cassette domain-containing protein [Candidatus Adiutrix sp.]
MMYHAEDLILTRPGRAGYKLHIKRLAVAAGEKMALTGPSGCGKSTALDLLGMVLEPDSAGRFSFAPDGAGLDLASAWRDSRVDFMADLRRRHIGYILQTGGLLPFLTVEENIGLTSRLKGTPEADIRVITRGLADLLGIGHLLASLPGPLSVGERQRVAIGRALSAKPKVVLADEPTAALDPNNARTVMGILIEAVKVQGATLIMVTHDQALVPEFSLREVPIRMAEASGDVSVAFIDDGPAGP